MCKVHVYEGFINCFGTLNLERACIVICIHANRVTYSIQKKIFIFNLTMKKNPKLEALR